MPPFERMDRKQKALLYAKEDDDTHGRAVVSETPEEIGVRWVQRQSEALDPQGATITVDATAHVGQEVEIGSVMWLGGLEDLSGTSLVPESDLFQVVTYTGVPDIKGRNTRREVGLIRFGSSLPTGD
jgi:hypothetical protein